ncbi:MAG: undecaprenyl-diphosphate phosphatase [Deltaproteobacteria bacterium]|nr:undecaprenyl-diphosphate phosphatase [Deltaproteobacteria bacterium]
MSVADAVLLGIVEGLTELLPVSSTGHLILVDRLRGQADETAKTLEIVIQLGAVLAVAGYFRARLAALARGVVRRERGSLRLAGALLLAFAPAAIAGLAAHREIKERLFGPLPVAAALIAGGVAMVLVEAALRRRGRVASEGIEHVTLPRACAIGLCQCLSLWPGASRSMTTIVGGQLCGLATKTAAEFSFLLAIPTLGAATVYDFAIHRELLLASPGAMTALGVGLGVSFVVAWLVVAVFLRYVGRIGMTPFGLYRIALGIVVLLL